MEHYPITAVGIDVSKGKSMVAVRRPGGEVVMPPFEVKHTASGLEQLIAKLKKLDGTLRVVMEHTGVYWRPIALTLKNAGFFVSVVNAMLIHRFSDNSLRKVKTDRADAMKIANYALTYWQGLRDYSDTDEIRQLLKAQTRLYAKTLSTSKALRNSLIALLDQTFPGSNTFFGQCYRTAKVTTNGWISSDDSGIKIAWQPFPTTLLPTPSQNGAKELDTTSTRKMLSASIV